MKIEIMRLISVVPPVSLICAGAYMVYPPAAFIVVGLLWLSVALPTKGK